MLPKCTPPFDSVNGGLIDVLDGTNGLGVSKLLFDWLNDPSNLSKELLEIVDSAEVLTLLDLDSASVLPFALIPDWPNGLAFNDVSLALIDELGFVSNEFEEILNAP